MKRFSVIILLILSLSACVAQTESGDDTAVSPTNQSANSEVQPSPTTAPPAPTDTPAPIAEVTDAPEATDLPATAVPDDTPIAEPAPEIVDPISDLIIVADDGAEIATTIYLPAGEGAFPGVILLHMLGGRRQDWENRGLTEMLTEAGYVVMAVDMRGHGDTAGSRDWALIEQDLLTVWHTFTELEQVDAENTAVVGGSIGSNMALITADNIPQLKTAVLLSPGLDYRGVTTDDRMATYGDRPLLIIASEEDKYSADSSRTLLELGSANTELTMLDGAGHGTNMLTQTAVRQEVVAWLDANLK